MDNSLKKFSEDNSKCKRMKIDNNTFKVEQAVEELALSLYNNPLIPRNTV